MNSKEKYIEFIVNDLVKRTEISYHGTDDVWLHPPFWPMPHGCPYSKILSFSFFYDLFPEHVMTKYGAKKEEIKNIWDQYSERIQNNYRYRVI